MVVGDKDAIVVVVVVDVVDVVVEAVPFPTNAAKNMDMVEVKLWDSVVTVSFLFGSIQ